MTCSVWILDIKLVVTRADRQDNRVMDQVRQEEHNPENQDRGANHGLHGHYRCGREQPNTRVTMMYTEATRHPSDRACVRRGGHLEAKAEEDRHQLKEQGGDQAGKNRMLQKPCDAHTP